MSLKSIRSPPFENTCASYDVAHSGTKRAPIPIRQRHGGGHDCAPSDHLGLPRHSPFRRMREGLISGKQRVEFGLPTSLPVRAAGSMCTGKSSIPGLLACRSALHDSCTQSTIVLLACGCTLDTAARTLVGAMGA